MIYVNSVLMGSGKTMAAITYMNEHPEKRFMYIAPYLTEDDRIAKACPSLRFIRPNGNYPGRGSFGKLAHVEEALRARRNIATTHQLFKMLNPDILDIIKDIGYVLIIDETLDVLEKTEFNEVDLQLLLDTNYLINDGGKLVEGKDKYMGDALRKDIFVPLRSRELVVTDGEEGDRYRWFLPIRTLTSFMDVFILTYLFDGQLMKYYLDAADIEYEKIGVSRDPDGTFRFSTKNLYTPEYVSRIHDMIHIIDDTCLNEIGDERTALSLSWFNGRGDTDRLRLNMRKYFREMNADIPPSKKMWGTFKSHRESIKDKGYTRGFVPFNSKATNEYADRTCVAYPVNVFMPPTDKKFFSRYNLEFDEDQYALSTMIQFLWRSAIRNGQPIQLYLPSSRMRTLLINWMDEISKGGGGTA